MLENGWKRLLSGFLALALVVGMLPPVAVRAEEGETTPATQANEAIETTEATEAEETTEATEITEPSETEETTEATEAEETEPTETVETEPDETEAEETLPEETREEIELYSETGIVASGTCGENLAWTLDEEGTLTISGRGDMTNYTYSRKAPWATYRSDIYTVVVSSGVTGLGNYAFESCRSITSITLPDSVTTIGYSAFEDCSSLTTITIPAKISSLSHNLFSGCSSLRDITIPDTVTSIAYSAFEDCSSLTDLTIPAKINSIAHSTFSGCSSLNTITIPNSVTSIGSGAFSKCSSLVSATVPDSVSDIGDMVFSGCSALKSITIPEKVTSIPAYAFNDCTSLTDVNILGRITSIGDNAFSGCTDLTGLAVPDSVKTIGMSAFNGCASLVNIVIPETVVSVGLRAFYDCTSLTDITVPSGVSVIGNHAFGACSNLTSVTIQEGVSGIGDSAFYMCTSLESLALPMSITSIGASAFAYCSSLKEVSFSDGITSIGEYAFRNCKSLTSVTIPKGITSIGDHAFDSCTSLTNASMGDGISNIGEYTFAYCTNLTSVTIPASVTSIGEFAFRSCSRLTEITLPESLISIGDSAFYGCSGLTGITLPESVTHIGDSAFYSCRKLTSVVISKQITSINSNTFYSCSKLTDVTIPESVTNIGDSAFRFCSKLQNVFYAGTQEQWDAISIGTNNTALTSATVHIYSITVVQPTCTEQGYTYHTCSACDDCYADNYVDALGHDFQEYVPYAGATCFDDATEIAVCGRCGETDIRVVEGTATGHHYTSTSIAPSCTEQGYTLHTCSSCSDSYRDSYVNALGHDMTFVEAVEPTYLEPGNNAYYICERCQKAFKDADGTQETTVEAESLPKLEVVSSGTCGDNLKWVLDTNGTLTISGTGAMYDYNRNGSMISEDSPFVNLEIKKLIFEEGITHIGNCAFISCTGDWGTVVLPESLESIGDEAFHRCTALTGTLVIPKNVRRIAGSNTGTSGLGGNRLTSISVAEGNQYFAVYDGILYTKNLTRLIACPGQRTGTVTFPENLKQIDPSAFFGCSGLTGDLIFPKGLQRIGMWAFNSCTGFNGKISLPDSLQRIELSAFAGCSSITGTLTLPSGILLDMNAFYGCSGLTEVYIPEYVRYLGQYAFVGCTNVELFTYDGTMEQWNQLETGGVVIANIREYVLKGKDFACGEFNFGRQYWACDNGTLTFWGEGTIPDYSPENPAPWSSYQFQNLEIYDAHTRIGAYAFQGHTELAKVRFNNKVTSVGANAFDGCTGMQKVDFFGSQEERYDLAIAKGNDPFVNVDWIYHFLLITGEQDLGDGVTSGQSTQLTAKMMPEGTVLENVEWYLPEEYRAYAALSSDGTLTAKTVSQAVEITVWAIQEDYGRGGMSFYIRPKATGLTIDQGTTLTVDMHQTSTLPLTATAFPSDAAQRTNWTTSDKSVATVSETGVVTLQKPGTVTITAKTTDGANRTAKITLTVYYLDTAKTLTVRSDAPATGLQPGQTAQLTVTGTKVLDTADLSFSIPENQQHIATVDDAGVVTAGNTPGTATVTVTIRGDKLNRKATCKITTISYQAEAIRLYPTVSAPAETGTHGEELLVFLDARDVQEQSFQFVISALGQNYLGGSIDTTVTWASGNTAIATVTDNKDGTATVTVKKGASGECAITATSKDAGKVSANLWLSVRDYAPRLESSSLSMNLYQTSTVEIGLAESYGNAIEAVSVDDNFDATWADGTLAITVQENVKKGTYTQTLSVTCANGETYEYTLKIKVTETAPTVTIKQSGKYNLFYTDGTATLKITAKNAQVTDVTIKEGDFTVESFENGTLTLKGNGENHTAPGKQVTLKIIIAGYEKWVEKTVTLATVTTAPKLKLSATSSVINTGLKDTVKFTTFQVLNGTDVLELTEEDITYSGSFATCKVDGDITLTLTGDKGGTATFNIQQSNWTKSVKLTHKVTVQTAKPTMKLSTTTLKLNSVFPAVTAEATVSLSQANLALTDVVITPKTSDLEDVLSVTYDNSKITAKITGAVKAGTYTYTCTGYVGETALKAVTLKVTVSATTPKVKLASTTFKLNTKLAGKESISTKVTVPTGYTLVGFDTTSKNFEYKDGYLIATLGEDDNGGSYTLYPVLIPNGSDVKVTLDTGIKVKVTTYTADFTATVSAKGKLDTLNPDSSIAYTVKLKNCAGTVSEVKLTGQDAELFEAKVEDGKVIVTMKDTVTYATNKTYKVTLNMKVCGVTVTKAVSFKVSQSTLKVTASPATVTCYQSTKQLSTTLKVTSPTTAKIADVALSSKTAAAFRNAFGDGSEIVFNQNTGKFTMTLSNPGLLTPGKSYTLYLDVTPQGNAENVKPTQVKLTVKVQK